MEAGGKLRLADVFVSISDPRQSGKVEYDLVELLVVAVNAVLVGADTQANIAQAIRERGADYILAVKDNQPKSVGVSV